MSERNEDASEHDPEISAIYRKTGDLAPPTSLDDAILAAARRAAWRSKQRWMLPLSTAAVVMVSVTLLLNMNDEWDFSRERGDDTPTSQSLPSASRPESRSAEKPTPSLPAAPQELAFEEESYRWQPAEVSAKKPAPAAPSSRGLAPESTRLSKSTPVPSEELTEQQAARSSAERSGVLAFSNDFSSLEASAGQESAKREEDSANPATDPRKKVLKQHVTQDVVRMERDGQNSLEPKPWLAKIRELVATGKTAAGRKELESFKKRYPDYTLPDDLKSFTKLKEDIPTVH